MFFCHFLDKNEKKENEKDRKFLKRVKVDAFLENSYNKKHRILHLKGGIGMIHLVVQPMLQVWEEVKFI